MTTTKTLFQWELDGETLILTPQTGFRERNNRQIAGEGSAVLAQLEGSPIRRIVLDSHKVDCFGPSALKFFLELWRRVRERGGRLVFCNVSDSERELLQATWLNRVWPIFPTRGEALAAVEMPGSCGHHAGCDQDYPGATQGPFPSPPHYLPEFPRGIL
jgi:anti-anti-sigma factor